MVAGHQRLAQSDVLAKGQDYTVTVAVVDVDEKTERELNVRLNNDTIRGAYDVAGIDDLLRGGADYQAMGFDLVSLENLYIGAGVDLDMSILLGGGRADSDEGDIDAGRQSAAEIEDQLDEADVAKQQEAERKKIAKIRERRKEFDAKAEFDYELECSSSIVFPTGAMRAAFMRAVGLDEHETRIDGVSLCRFLGLDVPEFRSIKEPSITKSVQEPGTGSETGIEKPASPGENVGVADSGSAETLPAGGVSLPPARPITKINLEI
ncbi:MAG: hypothetical protein NT069_21995 [Planctomycetota bacterium]|nr:hypothetical protein [Planctomycetota bacterium]